MVGAEPLAHALEAEGHRQALDLRVDGRRRPELLLHAGQLRIGELAQTLAVRLLALGRAAHQRARDAEQAALEAGAAFEVGVLGAEVARAGGRLLDVGPGVADPGERGVLGHAGAQLGLIGALLRHELLVEQRIELLAAHLDAVLEAEQRVGDDAALGVALLRELDVAATQLAAAQQPLRQVVVALRFELRDGEQAVGGAGVARDQHELARRGAVEVDAQRTRHLHRLAVLVGAQQAHVEAPARELEVVRVAAEGCDARLGREHEAHIGVALVAVEELLAAVVERDRLALEAGVLLAGLLERGDRALAGLVGGALVEPAGGGLDLGGHILHADEDIRHLRAAGGLVLAVAGDEAVVEQALLLGGVLGEAAGDAVVVGEDQAVRRHEGRRAAGEPHRGLAHAVEPGGVDVDPVPLLHLRGGEVVVGPHAFVGTGGVYKDAGDEGRGEAGDEGETAHGTLRGSLIDRPILVESRVSGDFAQ